MARSRWAHRLAAACLLATLGGCIASYDPNTDFHTGEEARKWIFNLSRVKENQVPASATDFRLYNGGNFNGLDRYWTYTCGSVEDCYRAIEAMGGPKRDQFQPWGPSKLGVIMDGPRYQFEGFQPGFWPIRAVTNGVQIEVIWNVDRRLESVPQGGRAS